MPAHLIDDVGDLEQALNRSELAPPPRLGFTVSGPSPEVAWL